MAKGPVIRKKGASTPATTGPDAGNAPPPPATAASSQVRCLLCHKIAFPFVDGLCPTCDKARKKTQAAERRLLEPEHRSPPKPAPADPVPFGQLSLPDLIMRWRPKPWLFVREIFGATPDLWQDIILHAVVGLDLNEKPLPPDQPYDKIALKACKGPGKTCVEAWIAWWFLLCFEDPNILATSITGENLRDNLWKEMAVWQNKAPILKAAFEWQTTRIFLKERPETWWMSARQWPKDADKTQQANSLAGLHARNTLLLIDESGDVPESVLVAGLAHHSTTDADGKDLGGEQVHITLQCGNPTSLDGSLGIACTRDRNKWFVYEITGDPDDPARAPRMDIKWCREQIDTYGADFDWVRINVFGKFPRTQDDKLLGPEIVKAAMQLAIPAHIWRMDPRVAALDVARSLASDRSALCRRQGQVVFPFKTWRLDDTEILIGQVVYEIAEFGPVITFVDATGIGGPVADRLRGLGFNVVMVYFGNPARDNRRFFDKRSEIWWTMAQEIKGTNGKPRLALPNNPELTADLTAPKLKFVSGKVRLESKEDMKKRGVKSPDLGDALAMTYSEPAGAAIYLPTHAREAMDNRSGIKTEYDPFKEEW